MSTITGRRASTIVYDEWTTMTPASPSIDDVNAARARLRRFVVHPGKDSKHHTFFARQIHAACVAAKAKYPVTYAHSSLTVTITKGKARALINASDKWIAEQVVQRLSQ